MNPHNDLLNKGCAKATSRLVMLAGGVIVIALSVIYGIAICGVG